VFRVQIWAAPLQTKQYTVGDQYQPTLHVSLPIGDSVLMGSDVAEGVSVPTESSGFAISYAPETKEEADDIFPKLTEGGDVMMPLQETFWGSYFGQGTDRFGVRWMVNVTLGCE
jgi:PhnB protein